MTEHLPLLSEQLKHYTASNHQELEKLLVNRIRSIRSTDDYERILVCFYRFFGAIESQLDQLDLSTVLPDFSSRRKASSIRNDVLALGGRVPDLLPINDVPQVTSIEQALGALYVIEGSTMGGEIVAKMISKQLGGSNSIGLSFFSGYGALTFPMWLGFKAIIDHCPLTNEQTSRALATANETFKGFADHLRQAE